MPILFAFLWQISDILFKEYSSQCIGQCDTNSPHFVAKKKKTELVLPKISEYSLPSLRFTYTNNFTGKLIAIQYDITYSNKMVAWILILCDTTPTSFNS